MSTIPEDYTAFLYWLKEHTEAYWSIRPPASPDDDDDNVVDLSNSSWLHGAKWIGLTDAEIDNIEAKYAIKFTPEHREFLRILHTTDKKEKHEYRASDDEDAEVLIKERSLFHNWLEDDEEIKRRMKWPFETILEDVTGSNRVWLNSWGPRPESVEEQSAILAKWFEQAPRLIPVLGHRFQVSDMALQDRPVLSVWGSDIIVYGWDFKYYLLNELSNDLDVYEPVYDEEDKEWYSDIKKEIRHLFDSNKQFESRPNRSLPCWKEMIMYWSSGWSSFGLEYPRKNDGPQPIVKADRPENEQEQQKRFNPF